MLFDSLDLRVGRRWLRFDVLLRRFYFSLAETAPLGGG